MERPEEIKTRQRADQALRKGRPREALPLYLRLLDEIATETGHYEAWLAGAAASYLALGRQREAGFALIGLGRFSEAQRHFPAAERPLEWALCAARLGRHGEAARVLSEGGHPALAAIELEEAGAAAAARLEWERVIRDPRLAGRPYETALAHFNLGEALMRMDDRGAAARQFEIAERLLEAVADDFESRGERERAFECYGVLLRLGKDTESFETVAEGYLNWIRLRSDDREGTAQCYDDFLTYAVERKEWYAAATIAREAAEHSLKTGLPYDRHYLGRAADLWLETARANQAANGPVDLSANALHAAVEAGTELGDLAFCGRIYAELAELPLPGKRRRRYRALARRYDEGPSPRAAAAGISEYSRRPELYADVWRQDLVEWELDGDPTAVLARLYVRLPERSYYGRRTLRTILTCNDPGFSLATPRAAVDLALALGRVPYYEVLRPLERLYEQQSPDVRAAVMSAIANVSFPRSFNLVRRGLADPSPAVADEALRALRSLNFRDSVEPLTRIFREATDERVRLTALETIARVPGTAEPARVLIEAMRQETGAIRQTAEARLGELTGDEAVTLVRQARDVEVDDRRDVLDRILRAMGGGR
jgi:tetratricopeptide (TPR) repeat protein